MIIKATKLADIYLTNQHRTITVCVPVTQKWLDAFGSDIILFYKAFVNVDGKLEITGRPLNYDPGW